MNKAFLVLTLLLSLLNAKDFNLIFQKPLNDTLLDIKTNNDSSLTAVGFVTNYTDEPHKSYSDPYKYLQSTNQKDGTHMYLLNIQKDTSIKKEKTYALSSLSSASSVVITPSNGYIVGGESFNGKLVLLKLNANATLQKKVFFGTTNKNILSKLIALKDSGVLTVGSSMTTRSTKDDIFLSGLGGEDIFLTRFSKNLKKLWSKKLGTTDDDNGVDVIELRDGSFILLSNLYSNAKQKAIITKLTQNGETLWKKELFLKTNIEGKKLLLLQNGDFLVVLNSRKNGKNTPLLKRYSKQGTLLKSKLLNFKASVTINDIAEFSNKRFIAVGVSEYKDNNDALVLTLTSSLNLSKKHLYGEKNYDAFYTLDILRDSTVAIAGVHRDTNSQQSDMWIIKTDEDGTLVTIPSTYKKIKEELNFLLQDSPCSCVKSTDNSLSLDLFSKELYFEQGKYKLTKKHKKEIEKFSPKLIKFLKLHKKDIKYLEISGYTSTEWTTQTQEERFLKNSSLSSKRAYSTLSYFFKLQNKEMQHYLTKILKGSSLSYSEVIKKNGVEDKEHSRRVSFRIILK